MKNDPIQDFIMASEKNLTIAAAVSEAWPESKEILISGFLKRLGLRLIKQLKGWKFDIGGRFFIESHPSFSFWKRAWENQYWIILQSNNYGEKMLFGVGRDEIQIAKRPFCAEVLDVVRTLHPSARSTKWYEAQVTMRSPAADWRKAEVLWRMHTEIIFLNDVAEQLLEVAKSTEHIIDKLARQK